MAVELTGDALQPFQKFLADYSDAYQAMDIRRIGHMPKLRFTLLLEQQQGHWKLVQIHASAPLSTQEVGRSFPEE